MILLFFKVNGEKVCFESRKRKINKAIEEAEECLKEEYPNAKIVLMDEALTPLK